MAVVHAILLGLCVLVTELSCSKYRQAGGLTTGRIILGAAAGVLVALAGIALGLHHCDQGQPLQQWLIPAACVACVVAYVRPRRERFTLAAALTVLAVCMSLHYGALVHGTTYVGTSEVPAHAPLAVPPRAAWHSPLTGLYLR